jgi:hypothetical protein
VDELHSIENTGDILPPKTLTYAEASVKRHSFFDSFRVFPVGAKSGAEAKSQSMFRDTRIGGAVTVYSEALVEENRELQSRAG